MYVQITIQKYIFCEFAVEDIENVMVYNLKKCRE